MSDIFKFEERKGENRIAAIPIGTQNGVTNNNYVEKNTNYPKSSRLTNLSKSVPSKPLTNSSKKEAVIDVVHNFDWTSTPINNSGFPVIPPSITLVEHKMTKSALITQLAYSTLATFDSIGHASGELKSKLDKYLDKEKIKAITDAIGVAQGLQTSSGAQWMTPYDGLYSTELTQFVYKFPYFSNTYRNTSNIWGDTYSGDGKNAIVDVITNFIPAATDWALGSEGIFRPGVFIEKTKYYQYSSQGEQFSFTFPLINTLNPDSVSKNYQLLFLLIFQNRPYRRTRALIDPSHLYEIKIPGTRYVKWGVIDTLGIDFVGTRREMSVTTPGPNGGSTTIKTIVPEAYMVNITMSSLTTETGNFMLELLQKGGS